MRKLLIVLALTGASLQCQYGDFVPNPDYLAQNCPAYLADLKVNCAMPDLAPPQPKCAAAKGLTGDAIVCVDFDKLSGLSDQTVKDWNFTPGGGCPGWEIVGGKLQVKNFGAFVGTCSFTMPLTDLAAAANQKYQSVTLAVVQTLDLNPAKQGASAYLGVRLPSQQIWYTTGTNPKTVTSLQIAKAALPNGGTSLYQPLFELTSALAGGATGWQIESIAVMGNP
jgi:hypothetical protein